MSFSLLRTVNGASSDKAWAWVDTGPGDGAWNMAADQFFAERMNSESSPVMRVYSWHPWCISLGYHQSADCLDLNQCKARRIDVVRRQTGGRAVFHAQELTYSVVLPRGHRFAESVSDTYRMISMGLAAGLQRLGIPASFEKRSVDLKSHYEKKISASCFSAAALHEIVIEGRKLVGSAQRRLPVAVLQHGSILTGPAHLDLFHFFTDLNEEDRKSMIAETLLKTTTIESHTKTSVSLHILGDALKQGVADCLGVTFQDTDITEVENQAIESRKHQFSIFSA